MRKFIRKIICRLKGHKYYVIKEYSPTVRKLGCSICKSKFGMNDRVKAVIPWDSELEELHEGEWRKDFEGATIARRPRF